jgi:hypothetical protein
MAHELSGPRLELTLLGDYSLDRRRRVLVNGECRPRYLYYTTNTSTDPTPPTDTGDGPVGDLARALQGQCRLDGARKMPGLRVQMDLREGIGSWRKVENGVHNTDGLCGLLRWITDSQLGGGKQEMQRARATLAGHDFAASRGALVRVSATPYKVYDNRWTGWKVQCMRWQGTIYLVERTTEAAMAEEEKMEADPAWWESTYYGFKFENLLTCADGDREAGVGGGWMSWERVFNFLNF